MKKMHRIVILLMLTASVGISAQPTVSSGMYQAAPDLQTVSVYDGNNGYVSGFRGSAGAVMSGSGTNYSPNITAVGADYVPTVGESPVSDNGTPPPSGPRRVGRDDDIGEQGSDVPLGNGVAILLLLSIVYVMKRKNYIRKKSALALVLALVSVSAMAEGYETMAKVNRTTYYTTDVIEYTGDNGMTWTLTGAFDSSIGGYKALTVSATVSGNGIRGNLTSDQTLQGVGTVSFYVKGMKSGTGYGNRTFRVSAGSKSVDVVINIPSMTSSYRVDAQLDAVGASKISISALPSLADETATFGLYNISWTSFDGKTFKPTLSTDAEYIATGTDTVYYTTDEITVDFASATENAKFYYTTNGSTPSTSSYSGTNVNLPIGTHTLNVVAWSEDFGLSDVVTKIFKVNKGTIWSLDGTDTSIEGSYSTAKTGLSGYESKTGLPFYMINKSKNHLITPVAVNPMGFSLYAYAINSKNLAIAYQKGTYIYEGSERTWETDGNWTDITNLINPSDAPLTRYEIDLPAKVKNNAVKFRLTASGNSVYIDDITTIDQFYNQLAMPTLSHESGQLAAGTKVTITPAAGTTLHYTVNNGAEKTGTSAVTLTINEATTLEAYATQSGKANSWIVRAHYTVGSTEGFEGIDAPVEVQKVLRDGQVLIIRNGVTYTVTGMRE